MAKPTIVLLHGAFQNGPSTWKKVQPQLKAHGYKVIVVNLPGRNGDKANVKDLSLDTYRDAVLAALASETQPVILVGHSFGGITISHVAEAAPEKIKALVYLSAYLPKNGESLLTLAQADRDSYLGKPGSLLLSDDDLMASINEDLRAEIFGNDAQAADREAIVASLIPEPAAPQAMPVRLTEANFGRLPKFYISTTEDHCVSPYLQEQMIARAKVVRVTKIPAGHASYITMPAAVVAAILDAAQGSVLALHEVLMAELGDVTPLDEADAQRLAEYKFLAVEADIRRKEREAVLKSAKAKPEEKEAMCQLAQNEEQKCLGPLMRMLHARQRSALCFSGGGIRSATFCLGILQGLAKHSLPENEAEVRPTLLADFDYLSTVSGGGYIGSWFSSWVSRSGIDAVLRHLAYRAPGKIDPEAKPILYLRDYTNYLDPRLGLFSGDTWTLVATVVRNMLLNWFVLLPFVAALLLAPVLFLSLLSHTPPPNLNWLLAVGFGCGVLGTATLLQNLPSFGNARHDQKTFILWCLGPLVSSAIFLALWWCWLPESDAKVVPLLYFALFGAAIHFCGVGLGALVSRLEHAENFRAPNFKLGRFLFAWIAAMVTGALGAGLVSLVAVKLHPASSVDKMYFACFAVPLILATLMAVAILSVGISSRLTTDDDREWWSRAGGWMLVATVGWLAVFALVLPLPYFLLHLQLHATQKGIVSAVTAGLGWLVSQAGSKSEAPPATSSQAAPQAPSALDKLKGFIVPLGAVLFLVSVAVLLTVANGFLVERLRGQLPFANAALLVIEISLAFLASAGVNVNKFSLHAMYRMRLIRAYLGASNTTRTPNPFTGFDPADNLPLQDLSPEKPFHVLNQTLNLVSGAKLAWQQRKAETFTMTRLHSGSFRVGYQPSNIYGHGVLPGGLTLGTAMAISGAAASPNMGYQSSPLIAIVMTLFNARLGWWLANPGEAGRGLWDMDGPAFGVKPFLDEALGQTNDENNYIYLSDGGHFENLGIYEMVLRRCKHIVAIDCGADNKYIKEDLGNAVRKVRIDLGIPIEFPQGIQIDRELGLKGKRCALGVIRYDVIDEGAEPGQILYIKPVMTGTEPADVKNYASLSRDFPQESTADQWFTESQFESYRNLAAFTLEEIIHAGQAVTIPELFEHARRYLADETSHRSARGAAAGDQS